MTSSPSGAGAAEQSTTKPSAAAELFLRLHEWLSRHPVAHVLFSPAEVTELLLVMVVAARQFLRDL